MTQENALVKRCQHGDRQAFDELIRLHYDDVFRFLVKLTQDPPLAEDLTQETFLKMIRSIELYTPAGTASFRTWLLTIAKNCCIDHMRRSRITPISTEGLVLALIAGLACIGWVGWLYRDRLNFAWQYSRLEEAKDANALQQAADKTAAATPDVVDVLVLDDQGRVTYSAKHSAFGEGTLELSRVGESKKYLASPMDPDAVFQYVKSEEFMLQAIINKDFGRMRKDYADDTAFEPGLSEKTVYMLSQVRAESGSRVCVLVVPTSVPGGLTALKLSAVLAMLFFGIYWVLVALWIYRDAARCRLSPLYWGLIGLFTNLVGLVVYKICKHGMAVCPACGTAQNPENRFCTHCGQALGARCASCGGKVSPRDSYCSHCGAKIEQ